MECVVFFRPNCSSDGTHNGRNVCMCTRLYSLNALCTIEWLWRHPSRVDLGCLKQIGTEEAQPSLMLRYFHPTAHTHMPHALKKTSKNSRKIWTAKKLLLHDIIVGLLSWFCALFAKQINTFSDLETSEQKKNVNKNFDRTHAPESRGEENEAEVRDGVQRPSTVCEFGHGSSHYGCSLFSHRFGVFFAFPPAVSHRRKKGEP